MTQPRRCFGWKPQKPDIRDRKFAFEQLEAELPEVVDLREGCPAPYDQGQLGSCTANAIAFLCEYDWLKEKKAHPFVPSRLFVYYNERQMEGTVDSDAGAEIRDGIKTLNIDGFCPEDLWPYDTDKFAVKPIPTAYAAAKKQLVKDYGSVDQDLMR